MEERRALPIDPRRLVWALSPRWRWIALGALAGLTLGTLGVGLCEDAHALHGDVPAHQTLHAPDAPGRGHGRAVQAEAVRQLDARQRGRVGQRARTRRAQVQPAGLGHRSQARRHRQGGQAHGLHHDDDLRQPQRRGHRRAGQDWSEEIIDFTREIQSQESHEIRKVIQSQLDANQTDSRASTRS